MFREKAVFINQILLENLRKSLPGFVAPQMYMYLDNPDLLKYIESNLETKDVHVEHSFDEINGGQVCVH